MNDGEHLYVVGYSGQEVGKILFGPFNVVGVKFGEQIYLNHNIELSFHWFKNFNIDGLRLKCQVSILLN